MAVSRQMETIMTPRRAALFLTFLAGSSAAAGAADCSFSDNLAQAQWAAKVTPGPARVYFADAPDKAGECPSKRCPYVTPGDQVVVTDTLGAAACATFTSKSGRATTGWLPTERLKATDPKPAEWAGYWGDAERSITIRADGAKLAIDGRLSIQQGGPAFSGAFKAQIGVAGSLLAFATDAKGREVAYDKAGAGACKVKLVLAGPVLLVHDEGCVGVGSPVTFEGSYTRRK